MRNSLILFAAVLFTSASLHAQFTNGQAAQRVLGQTLFSTKTQSGLNPTASDMSNPQGVAVDPTTGKIFVADASNNRVLRFADTLTNGAAAEAVFGQTSLTANAAGAVGQARLNNPYDVVVDGSGRLWVADYSNCRVLWFNNASTIATGANADGVLGQPDFNTGSAGLLQGVIAQPSAIAVDASGNLYVADQANNRVLRFNNAAGKANGAAADGVYGQADYTHNTGGSTQSTYSTPTGVTVDGSGTLYIVDQVNNRVLRIASASTKSGLVNADGVIGQVNFTSVAAGTTQSTLSSPFSARTDGSGRLYISDQGNHRILRYNSASTITTGTNNADGVLGQTLFTTASAPSTPTASSLNTPAGMSIDNQNGKMRVVDNLNTRVIRYTSSTVPLPVELTSFSATFRNGKVELAWATATEVNNYGFEVERKTINNDQSTMNNWEKLGFVEGHGTTNAPQSYSFTDAAARVGKFSYRLKQIDRDGKFEYHQAVDVTLGISANTVWLDNNYPNPFNPSTKISFVLGTTGVASLKVYDLLGKEVITLADGVFNSGELQSFTFDASKYPSGIYYYQLKSGTRTEMKKMLLLK